MAASGAHAIISDTQQHAGRDNHITTINNHFGNNIYSGPDPLVHLRQYTALGALHDAAERPDPPRCHEETRIAILDRVDRWARDRSVGAQPILWLSGAAGAGKSAICQTLIERWLEDELIAPNFFLWRTAPKRNQKTYVLPTIAFQLSELLPETKTIIEDAVRDGSVFQRNLKAQVDRIIVNPLRRCHPRTNTELIVVVIDGLDECREDIPRTDGFLGQSHEDQQRELLEAIAFASQKVPSLRFLIASRPEPQIRKSFGTPTLSLLTLSLSLNHEDTTADIRLYLDCRFAEIRSAYPGISPSWPSKEQIGELVKKSSGQFIYPSTVVKHVSQLRRHPVNSLQEVLALQPRSDDHVGHPLAELDALYAFVLGIVDTHSLPAVMVLLGHMVHYYNVRDYLHPLNIFEDIRRGYNTGCIEKYLFLEEGELSMHLTDLHSIVSFTPNTEDEDSFDEDNNGFMNIGFFHATFSEYLLDQSRSGNHFVGKADTNLHILHLLLKHGNTELTPPPNPEVYDLRVLYCAISYWIDQCPPSLDLKKQIWSHFRYEIGEYSTVAGNNMGSVASPMALYNDQPDYFQGEISPYLGNPERQWLLEYLQSCNVPEFEPSKQRRCAIGHLIYLLKVIDWDGRFNNLEYLPPSEELGDYEDEEDEEEIARSLQT